MYIYGKSKKKTHFPMHYSLKSDTTKISFNVVMCLRQTVHKFCEKSI